MCPSGRTRPSSSRRRSGPGTRSRCSRACSRDGAGARRRSSRSSASRRSSSRSWAWGSRAAASTSSRDLSARVEILVLGLNHDTAPVELRERLAFSADAVKGALAGFKGATGLPEGMILSTCNRVELYAAAQSPEAGLTALEEFLCRTHGVGRAELSGRLYARSGKEALVHIFRVASSLD